MSDERSLLKDETEVYQERPVYGWQIKLNHVYNWDNGKPVPNKPSAWQICGLLGMAWRIWRYAQNIKGEGKVPFMDPLNPHQLDEFRGMPLGGLGATVGRSIQGQFNKWQIHPGIYTYNTVWVNQFIVRIERQNEVFTQVLCASRPSSNELADWNFGFDGKNGTYHCLYPRSWQTYEFPEQKIVLECRTTSPFLPNNYKNSSLPTTAFDWKVINEGDSDVRITLAFTWRNGCEEVPLETTNQSNKSFSSKTSEGGIVGVELRHENKSRPYHFAVAAKHSDSTKASSCRAFNASQDSKQFWSMLANNGDIEDLDYTPLSNSESLAGAVALSTAVSSNSTKNGLTFSLSWDIPEVVFGEKRSQSLFRRYTDFFGTDGKATPAIATYTLSNVSQWDKDIYAWQSKVLEEKDYPDWYKCALFNETYYIADGGTVWSSAEEGYPEGKFLYLEGHEYRMYNTYDVHFYASWALIMLFPKLEQSLQKDFVKALFQEDNDPWAMMMDGHVAPQRSVEGAIPHDLGDPDDQPWEKLNCYNLHDTSHWKDLNCKFVLQIYRNYHLTKDLSVLRESWSAVEKSMIFLLKYDKDNDGVIENENFADQTYDVWLVDGISAYCGGLWLAAVRVLVEIQNLIGKKSSIDWSDILNRGSKSYHDNLWNGKYYDYDCSQSQHHDSIQADQLAGHWYLRATQLSSFCPDENVKKALETVYSHNVLQFAKGQMGALNGMRPDGTMDKTSMQTEEVWTGVTFGVAATMIQEGLVHEGFQTAKGIYNYVYNNGLIFQTPEGFFQDGRYRSLAYMRPLCIWSIQYALDQRKI